jgi:6-pyruvoyl-tetrahydropterin synthase
MFSLTVCDHIMIAHSLRGAAFGPAQALRGAAFAVEAEFRCATLDALHMLVDIGLARAVLRDVLAPLDYSNLDDNPDFAGLNTTAEHVAKHIHDALATACRDGRLGDGGHRLGALKVLIRESQVAWAAFEGPIA